MAASSPAASQPSERRRQYRISAIGGSPPDPLAFMVDRQAHRVGPGAEAGMQDGTPRALVGAGTVAALAAGPGAVGPAEAGTAAGRGAAGTRPGAAGSGVAMVTGAEPVRGEEKCFLQS